MSTDAISRTCERIEALEEAGQLVRFVPRLVGGEAVLRRISLAPRLDEWCHGGGRNLQLKAFVRAHLKLFAIGDMIDDRIFIKRVQRRYPDKPPSFDDQVWSLRPKFMPEHRFFGAFAVPDWFIGFHMQARSHLGSDDGKWNAALEKVCRTWDALLPGSSRVNCSRFSDCVSFKSEHKDERWDEI